MKKNLLMLALSVFAFSCTKQDCVKPKNILENTKWVSVDDKEMVFSFYEKNMVFYKVGKKVVEYRVNKDTVFISENSPNFFVFTVNKDTLKLRNVRDNYVSFYVTF